MILSMPCTQGSSTHDSLSPPATEELFLQQLSLLTSSAASGPATPATNRTITVDPRDGITSTQRGRNTSSNVIIGNGNICQFWQIIHPGAYGSGKFVMVQTNDT
mmetsp:Transcript_33640/g.49458  ORF Transcript_33640/g.49458 Transcript_33640/m.49458 type:complete len:104 (-) Transcript_33640:1834-2145(-)